MYRPNVVFCRKLLGTAREGEVGTSQLDEKIKMLVTCAFNPLEVSGLLLLRVRWGWRECCLPLWVLSPTICMTKTKL